MRRRRDGGRAAALEIWLSPGERLRTLLDSQVVPPSADLPDMAHWLAEAKHNGQEDGARVRTGTAPGITTDETGDVVASPFLHRMHGAELTAETTVTLHEHAGQDDFQRRARELRAGEGVALSWQTGRARRLREATRHIARQRAVLDGRRPGRDAHRPWRQSGHEVVRFRFTVLFEVVILLGLIAVEYPIYKSSFVRMGEQEDLKTALAFGVCLVMIAAPHCFGAWYRGSRVDGARPLLHVVFVLAVAAWVTAIAFLSELRQRVATTPPAGGSLRPRAREVLTPLDRLGMDPLHITLMFASLLALSGLVAFLLGYQLHNPVPGNLRRSVRERDSAELAYNQATWELNATRLAITELETERARHDRRWDTYRHQVESQFGECLATYRAEFARASVPPPAEGLA